ncbi:unnamed protein product [Rotaria socialis]|uniref:Uncharacterized protein n=2 Tax=Rotaria socialis TaxID=392032 RepID=A0A818L7N3_9BILA|nr:unnamed protein product [Rotaria socialis]
MPRHEMKQMAYRQAVVEQPQEIENVFRVSSDEKILQVYECDDRCCGCGPKYKVELTDARIIQRRKNKVCCCSCYHTDSMLFLSDISSVKDKPENDCRCLANPCSMLCCLFFTCCPCIVCCLHRGIEVAFRGGFGQEVFTFSRSQVNDALSTIPIAAIPHKTSSGNNSYQPISYSHTRNAPPQNRSNRNRDTDETF